MEKKIEKLQEYKAKIEMDKHNLESELAETEIEIEIVKMNEAKINANTTNVIKKIDAFLNKSKYVKQQMLNLLFLYSKNNDDKYEISHKLLNKLLNVIFSSPTAAIKNKISLLLLSIYNNIYKEAIEILDKHINFAEFSINFITDNSTNFTWDGENEKKKQYVIQILEESDYSFQYENDENQKKTFLNNNLDFPNIPPKEIDILFRRVTNIDNEIINNLKNLNELQENKIDSYYKKIDSYYIDIKSNLKKNFEKNSENIYRKSFNQMKRYIKAYFKNAMEGNVNNDEISITKQKTTKQKTTKHETIKENVIGLINKYDDVQNIFDEKEKLNENLKLIFNNLLTFVVKNCMKINDNNAYKKIHKSIMEKYIINTNINKNGNKFKDELTLNHIGVNNQTSSGRQTNPPIYWKENDCDNLLKNILYTFNDKLVEIKLTDHSKTSINSDETIRQITSPAAKTGNQDSANTPSLYGGKIQTHKKIKHKNKKKTKKIKCN